MAWGAGSQGPWRPAFPGRGARLFRDRRDYGFRAPGRPLGRSAGSGPGTRASNRLELLADLGRRVGRVADLVLEDQQAHRRAKEAEELHEFVRVSGHTTPRAAVSMEDGDEPIAQVERYEKDLGRPLDPQNAIAVLVSLLTGDHTAVE